jgi:hypothetical protein
MLEQTGLKLRKWITKILRATSDVFKVERCGSSLLTSNRKMNLGKLLISEQNCKQKVL